MLRTILTLIGGRDYVPSQTAQKQAFPFIRAGKTTTLGHVILTLSGDILVVLPEGKTDLCLLRRLSAAAQI